MAGRIRILFLRLLISAVLLSGTNLACVFAAEEDSSQPEKEKEKEKDNAIKDIQVEEGTDQVIQPVIHRREISIDKIDTEDFEIGVYSGLLSTEDFGTNLVVGSRAAYHINEYFFTELAYAASETTETSYERLSGGAQLLTPEERKLTYYNVSLGFNLLPGEAFVGSGYAFKTDLYVIGGVGITQFAGDDRFTINYGGGYRFLATDWFAIHFDVRDHVFKIDLLGVEKTTHNLETHGGITVFF